MVEYLSPNDRSGPNTIWKELAKALEVCTADVPSDYQDKWESDGCEMIQAICQKYGEETTIRCLLDNILNNPTDELYWIARAQIQSVIPYLEPYLDSEDEDELTKAINALLYFDHQKAWLLLESIISGNSDIQLLDKTSWYFEDDLAIIGNHRALGNLRWMTKNGN